MSKWGYSEGSSTGRLRTHNQPPSQRKCSCSNSTFRRDPVYGFPPQTSTSAADSDITQTLEANLVQGHATLNDMFREVEQLMEDTQHTLEEAVYQMDNESARSILYAHDLPPNYHEESSTEKMVGNQSIRATEKLDKVTDNRTGEIHFSRTLIRSGSQENHDCIIDEDCEKDFYCLYETLRSKCLPCKALDTPCTKDEECCTGQLCLWGQCSENATKGEPGSICQYQSDCNRELCCGFHKALLFPVCTAMPMDHERCYNHPNHLMELLSWDVEGEGPREHCPCAGGLQCQPRGRGSLCLRPQNSSSEEDLTDMLYSEIDYIV
ncbi:hypothetical protein AAFF_G00383140 [Aldrovandia affinis]|uniref:Dickkopf N-terminal cysteine-rich domain-containing protein n=1 Tax=Aldrovandia affinis TaxID=143900 RepID=A0AAD7X0S5_9TELE|nr:hypothetical protein AAFF_G00383140 [Aldrovandia affinis]